MVKLGCDHCKESYHEDNIDECVNCKVDTCPRCACIVRLPGRKPREWWCHRCLKEIGRADLTRGGSAKEDEMHYQLAVADVKGSIINGMSPLRLDWNSNEDHREMLTMSLRVLGFDVAAGSPDFKVSPQEMPPESGVLILTGVGKQKLEEATGEALLPPNRPIDYSRDCDDE